MTKFRYQSLVKLAFTLLTGFGSMSACHAILKPSPAAMTSVGAAGDAQRSLKLVWLSLDALNADNLKPYLEQLKNPHPHGLKWLIERSRGKHDLEVSFPSITAPSHVSTMTCASPAVHGVFLNSGNWNGERDLNGFAMPYSTETWVQALRKNGVRVGVASYPSVDGTSAERSADFGVAYDAPKGKVQYIKLSSEAPTATIDLVSHQIAGKVYHETLTLKDDGELIAEGDIGRSAALKEGQPIDLFFYDGEEKGKETSLRKAAVTLMYLGKSGSDYTVAVSPVSVMPTTGAVLQAVLDQKDIVWSNLRDYGLAKYGDGVTFSLEATRHRRTAEIAAVHEMMNLSAADALFVYFEDIDVMLHGWSGVTRAENQLTDFIAGFDQDLGKLIESFPADTNLVVMGDHGMSSIQYELNVRKLIAPEIAKNFQIRSSGGTLALYPAGKLDSAIPADLSLQDVAATLRDAVVEFDQGRKIFRKIFVNGTPEAQAFGISGPKSPWIMAFADEGISIVDRMDDRLLVSRRDSFVIPEEFRTKYPDPINNGVLVQPSPLGAHGHDSTLASMHTHLTLTGPKLDVLDLSKIQTNIQVVPAVSAAMGWIAPSSCR